MTLLSILSISILSSVFTVVFLLVLYRFVLHAYLMKKFDAEVEAMKLDFEKGLLETGEELLPSFRSELAEAFALEVEEFLPEFRKEVSEGFKEAGEELLPDYRREVEEAFEAALIKTLSGKIVEKTAVKVAQTGTSIVGTGLEMLFGKRPPR
ncbi:MAG: hypothetical protein CSA81_06445 [Acidobacteria bacterium]|nr:MAG: hypothetical protein CSA81_06445 [Acidobacteriota bacterium]PIE90690.1 MAG: hypothetical protein CR997_04565 [Acidobacteriota bacterium]